VTVVGRPSISLAAVTRHADLGLGETIYGIGALACFAGYALLKVPSNLLLARFGEWRWPARIIPGSTAG